MCLSLVGRSHNHHVPRGTRRRVRGLFRTEQKKCGDHQLDSGTHEEVQEGKMSSSPLRGLILRRVSAPLPSYLGFYLLWMHYSIKIHICSDTRWCAVCLIFAFYFLGFCDHFANCGIKHKQTQHSQMSSISFFYFKLE